MVLILFSWCLWFASALVHCSPPEGEKGVLAFEKHPRHDKNWWLWNLEVKEKPLITSCRDKEDKDNHKLVYKRSAHHPERYLETSILENGQSKCHHVRKRWLSGSFGFGSKKNLNKESRKWQFDSESIGSNSSSDTSAIQDPWMSKNKLVDRNRAETKVRKHSSRYRNFKKRVHPQIQQRNFESHPASADNILFRSSALTDHMKNSQVDERYQTRIPGYTLKTYYGDLQPLSTMYSVVWNKSYDPIYERYVTPFTELKINPLKQPHPFYNPQSTIPWYTPLNGGRKVEPTRVRGQLQSMNEEVVSKEVGKSKGKSESMKQGRKNEEIELIPKVYALSQLKDRKHLKKFSNQYGWFEPATNPIIVPGFKRKYKDIAATEDKTMRPFIVREEEPAPFDDEYIQVSRANRNQTKPDGPTNDHKLTIGGPIQLPSPYGFPGGVNISILVPNVPVPPHDAALVTTMSTEKNSKKKKERKKKVRYDDSIRDDLVSAPRSQATPQADVDLSNGEMELIKYQPLNPGVKYHVFDFKTNNFTLLNHIRNMTLDQVNWDKAFGMQTDSAKKSELGYDDDDDDIRVLYDERASAVTQRSTEKLIENTASFTWYRFSDYPNRIPQKGEKFRILPNVVNSGDDPSDVTDITFLRNGLYEQFETPRSLPKAEDPPKLNSYDKVSVASRDQWDVLDEDLKNIASGKRDEAVWHLKNRKREAGFNHEDDSQGYYRLSSGENSLRNPTNLIISALRKKSDKHRDRDFYDEVPEDRGRKRTGD